MLDSEDRRLRMGLLAGSGLLAYGVGQWLAPMTAYDENAVLLVSAVATQGAVGGLGLRYLGSTNDPSGAGIGGGALFGAGAAGLVGIGVTQLRATTPDHIYEMGAASALGAAAGFGTAWALRNGDRRGRVLGADVGWLVGMAVGLGFAPYTEYTEQDAILSASASALGMWVGGLMPRAVHAGARRNRLLGGGLAGSSFAAMGALAAGQFVDVDPAATAQASLVGLTATLMSSGFAYLGVPESRSGHARWQIGTALGGWGLGLALGSVYDDLTTDDLWLFATAASLGAWHGAFAPLALGRTKPRAAPGGMMIGAGGATLLAYGLSRVLDVDVSYDLEMLATTATGSMVGGGLGLMLSAKLGGPGSARALEIGSLVGLGLGIGLSHLTEYDAQDRPLLIAAASWGAWHGAWLASATGIGKGTSAGGRIGGGAMLGAGTGLTLGMVAAQFTELNADDVIEASLVMGAGNLVGGGLGLLANADRQGNALGLQIGGLAGLGLGLGISRFTNYDNATALVLGGSMWGAWHGAWLGAALAPDGDDLGRWLGGGTLLGIGAGFGLSLAGSQLFDVSRRDAVWGSVYLASGNLIGAGAGLLFDGDRPTTIGLLEGFGFAGLIAGLATARYSEFEGTDYSLIAYTTMVGAAHGVLARGYVESAGDELDASGAVGGMMLGAGIGAVGGMLLAQRLQIESWDIAELLMLTAAGDAIGWGLATWTGVEGPGYYGIIQGSGLAFTALGLWAAASTDFDGADRLMVGHGAMLGAWLGGWAPLLWSSQSQLNNADGRQHAGGVLLGLGAGAVAAGVGSQLVDFDKRDVGEMMLGSVAATVAGAGLGLALSEDNRVWIGIMQGTGILGTLAVGTVASHTEYDLGDAALGAVAGLYGVYEGAGLASLANASNRQIGGAMMLGGAVGALAGMYLGPYIHLDGTDMLMLLAGSAWGTWLGIWTTAVIDDNLAPLEAVKKGAGYTAVLTDVTLLATSIAISKLVEMTPMQFAWISIGGGIGALVGVLIGGVVPDGNIRMGLLFGSAGGLFTGAVLTSFVDLPGMGTAAAREEQPGLPPSQLDSVLGLPAFLPRVEQWFPSVKVEPIEGFDAAEQYLFTVAGTYR